MKIYSSAMTKRILVVDDEPDITNSVKEGLKRRGFDVDGYTEPLEALKNFKTHLYDLLLIDIRMPKMNGFELYKEIKRRDNDVRICFMTAYDAVYHSEFNKAFPELDERRFISKPATLSKLVERISEEFSQPIIQDPET